jgi:hypothetical protein
MISPEVKEQQTRQLNTIVGTRMGDDEYFTMAQIAEAFGIPESYIRKQVRLKRFSGAKLGKATVISAREFSEFVHQGHLEYKARPSRLGDKRYGRKREIVDLSA